MTHVVHFITLEETFEADELTAHSEAPWVSVSGRWSPASPRERTERLLIPLASIEFIEVVLT